MIDKLLLTIFREILNVYRGIKRMMELINRVKNVVYKIILKEVLKFDTNVKL